MGTQTSTETAQAQSERGSLCACMCACVRMCACTVYIVCLCVHVFVYIVHLCAPCMCTCVHALHPLCAHVCLMCACVQVSTCVCVRVHTYMCKMQNTAELISNRPEAMKATGGEALPSGRALSPTLSRKGSEGAFSNGERVDATQHQGPRCLQALGQLLRNCPAKST